MVGLRNAIDLVAEIESQIAGGELAPGDRIEPVRSMAARLGLAPNTVAAAYRILGERGYLRGEGRRGTFVASRPALTMAFDEPIPPGLVDLANGNPDPSLLPDLGSALRSISTAHVIYGAPAVDPDLAEIIRADLGGDGVATDHLAIVGGALDGIERVLGVHLRPGDRVAVEDPGYSSVIELVVALGLRPVPLSVDRFGIVASSLAAALEAGIHAVVVTPRAQNPTGAALSVDRCAELSELLGSAPDVVIIEDDHAGLVAGQPYHSIIPGSTRHWAVVRSVAKSLGPDLRLAGLVGDDLTIGRVGGRQALGAGWVSHLLQRLVTELLSSPDVRRDLDRAAALYAQRRAVVVDILTNVGVDVHGRSGMNVWVPTDDEAQVVAAMERRGFAVRSGARYRRQAPPGIRVSVAGCGVEVLEEAATALVEVIAPHRQVRSA